MNDGARVLADAIEDGRTTVTDLLLELDERGLDTSNYALGRWHWAVDRVSEEIECRRLRLGTKRIEFVVAYIEDNHFGEAYEELTNGWYAYELDQLGEAGNPLHEHPYASPAEAMREADRYAREVRGWRLSKPGAYPDRPDGRSARGPDDPPGA